MLELQSYWAQERAGVRARGWGEPRIFPAAVTSRIGRMDRWMDGRRPLSPVEKHLGELGGSGCRVGLPSGNIPHWLRAESLLGSVIELEADLRDLRVGWARLGSGSILGSNQIGRVG